MALFHTFQWKRSHQSWESHVIVNQIIFNSTTHTCTHIHFTKTTLLFYILSDFTTNNTLNMRSPYAKIISLLMLGIICKEERDTKPLHLQHSTTETSYCCCHCLEPLHWGSTVSHVREIVALSTVNRSLHTDTALFVVENPFLVGMWMTSYIRDTALFSYSCAFSCRLFYGWACL